MASSLASIPFADAATALPQIPQAAGVGQILGAEGRTLLIGRAAHLRRWFATHLGAGRPPRKGRRPPTDLSPVASRLAYVATTSGFQQRLLFERLMGEHVPLSARRDLKPPAYLHLDPSERFPRVTIRPAGEGTLFGPFRDRRAAQRALERLHKLIPLRPCDYAFEPDPALPLGLGCLYAQVRSCAAPCLARVSEEDYRGLAAQAARLLADPERRDEETARWLPAWVSDARFGLVVERGRDGVELYPVRRGAVLEDAACSCTSQRLDEVVAGLEWSATTPRDDRWWLSAWLNSPRKTGVYLTIADTDARADLVTRVRRTLDRLAD